MVTSPSHETDEVLTCSICQDAIGDDDQGIEIECGHVFHSICALEWFRFHDRSCPNCRSVKVHTRRMSAQERVTIIRRRKRSAPPHVGRLVASLDAVELRCRELLHDHREFRRLHAGVFKKDLTFHRRHANACERRDELFTKVAHSVVPGVPLMTTVEADGDDGDDADADDTVRI